MPEAAGISAKADILGDREMRDEAEFLMHDGDAGLSRGGGRKRRYVAPRNLQAAGIRPEASGEDVDERRFPRTVLSHQRVDTPGMQFDGNAAQHRISKKCLGNVLCRESESGHSDTHYLRSM